MNANHSLLVLIWVAQGLMSCEEVVVPEVYQPTNEHEAYEHGLKMSGLLETALGADWQSAAAESLASPQAISIPHQEVFYLAAEKPDAVGYAFQAERGQKIEIDLDMVNKDSMVLFIDLYLRDSSQTGVPLKHIASAQKSSYVLGFEVRETSDFVLRIQPELLRAGQCKVQIRAVPMLPFPVEGKNKRAIGSFFGDPRDGGRRKHHGIDIFAKRHTPIIAPTAGYIRFAGERGLGGQVVWMRDQKRDMTLYFAHLHDIMVETGQMVQEGDTLGTVGNTGNARTTPPHLHFGIYENGPIDPYSFVADQSGNLKRIRADMNLLGKRVRAKRDAAIMDLDGLETTELQEHQMLYVQAGFADTYRVLHPSGGKGLIHFSDVESMDRPIRSTSLSPTQTLQPTNHRNTFKAMVSKVPDVVDIHAVDSGYWYVRTADGQQGWIAAAP